MGWRIGKWKEGLFWGSKIPYKTGKRTYSFTHTASPSETIFPGRGVCQYRENLSPAYEQERGMVPP